LWALIKNVDVILLDYIADEEDIFLTRAIDKAYSMNVPIITPLRENQFLYEKAIYVTYKKCDTNNIIRNKNIIEVCYTDDVISTYLDNNYAECPPLIYSCSLVSSLCVLSLQKTKSQKKKTNIEYILNDISINT
jgi:hypothetical protein